MPLVVTAFVVVSAAWPLQDTFEQQLSRRLSGLAIVAVLFLILLTQPGSRLTVTVARECLEKERVIEQRSGSLIIRDGGTLARQTCNCHAIIRAACDRIAIDT